MVVKMKGFQFGEADTRLFIQTGKMVQKMMRITIQSVYLPMEILVR